MILHTLLMLVPGLLPTALPTPPTPFPARAEEVTWFTGPHMSALGKARQEDRMLALYFWMGGSAQCTRMFGETLQDPMVIGALQKPLCVGIDITTTAGARLVKRYGITTLPTLLFLSPEGDREEAIIGFITPANFLPELQRIESGTGTVSDFQQRVASSPGDLQLQHDLALKLRDVGDQPGHDSIIESIRQQDPRGKTVVGARLLFWEVRRAALRQGTPAQVDLSPVYGQVAKLTPRAVQYEAWNWLATFEFGREQFEPSRKASRKAWQFAAPTDRMFFGVRTTGTYWLMRQQLSKSDIEFMLSMSKESLALARTTIPIPETPTPMPAAGAEPEQERPESQLANAIDRASMAEFLSGHKKRAIQLIQEAITLDPANDELTLRLGIYRR